MLAWRLGQRFPATFSISVNDYGLELLTAAKVPPLDENDWRALLTPESLVEDVLAALNAGELGVVQLNGRYLLVTAAVLAEAEAIFPAAVALKVDPDAPAEEDPYADPRYQVPDDLIW